jgi:hypothetical protein
MFELVLAAVAALAVALLVWSERRRRATRTELGSIEREHVALRERFAPVTDLEAESARVQRSIAEARQALVREQSQTRERLQAESWNCPTPRREAGVASSSRSPTAGSVLAASRAGRATDPVRAALRAHRGPLTAAPREVPTLLRYATVSARRRERVAGVRRDGDASATPPVSLAVVISPPPATRAAALHARRLLPRSRPRAPAEAMRGGAPSRCSREPTIPGRRRAPATPPSSGASVVRIRAQPTG